MNLREIESLDNDAMNGRVAELVSRYWHRQGYRVEVGAKEGPVWSNLGLVCRRATAARTRCRLASVALGTPTRIKRETPARVDFLPTPSALRSGKGAEWWTYARHCRENANAGIGLSSSRTIARKKSGCLVSRLIGGSL